MPLHVQRQVVRTGETPEEREERRHYTLAVLVLLDLHASKSARIPAVIPPVGCIPLAMSLLLWYIALSTPYDQGVRNHWSI